LRYEAQAAWGKSWNQISPTGAYTDGYSTDRLMFRGKIQHRYVRGLWEIAPTANISYFTEHQGSYLDGVGDTIAAQTVALGEVRFGSEFLRDFTTRNGGVLRSNFGIAVVSNFNVTQTSGSQGFPLGNGAIRGRIDLGVATNTKGGWSLNTGAYFDGIGTGAYQAYGGSFEAKLEF
jgi:chitinase